MLLDRSPAYLGQLQSRLGIDPSPARSDLDKTRKSYLLACSVEGKSTLTVESYSRQLRILVDFLDPLGIKQLSEIDTQLVRLFLLYPREEKKVGKTTVNRYYRSLSAFFNWAIREGLVKDTPMRNIKPPEVPKTIPGIKVSAQLSAMNTLLDPPNALQSVHVDQIDQNSDDNTICHMPRTNQTEAEAKAEFIRGIQRQGWSIARGSGKANMSRAQRGLSAVELWIKFSVCHDATEKYWFGVSPDILEGKIKTRGGIILVLGNADKYLSVPFSRMAELLKEATKAKTGYKQLSWSFWCSSRWHGVRIPGGTTSHHRVEDRQKLSHARHECHLSAFPGVDQMQVMGSNDWVVSRAHQRSHVQSASQVGAAAPDRPLAT
jgi:hypothetical protein